MLSTRTVQSELTSHWQSTHPRIKSETVSDPDKQSMTHFYNDPEHGPTKIEVTKDRHPTKFELRVHKKVFHKPHADSDWVHHPEKDETDEELKYSFDDVDGRHHEVRHHSGAMDIDMWTDHTQSGGSWWDYGAADRHFTRHINGVKRSDGQYHRLTVGRHAVEKFAGSTWDRDGKEKKISEALIMPKGDRRQAWSDRG